MGSHASQHKKGKQSEREIAEAIDTAAATARELTHEASGATNAGEGITLPEIRENSTRSGGSGLELLDDVSLKVKVELGRTRMFVEDVLRLNENSVVELDKAAGDPVDIYVNDRHVARGEVLVVNDNFCVRVSEILNSATTVGDDD